MESRLLSFLTREDNDQHCVYNVVRGKESGGFDRSSLEKRTNLSIVLPMEEIFTLSSQSSNAN